VAPRTAGGIDGETGTVTHMTRTLAAVTLVAALAVAALGVHTAAGAAAAPDIDALAAELVDATNARRAGLGVAELRVDPALDGLADDWAEAMSARDAISHRAELGVDGWAAGARFDHIGENVGRGPTIAEIHAAFEASPTHAANIDDAAWTRIGVGVAVADDGTLYVAVNFSDR
jgi:uncharacterized protein YkwD